MPKFSEYELLCLAIAPPGAIINGLVTMLMLTNRHLRIQTNAYLAGITTAGFIYNAVHQPLDVAQRQGYMTTMEMCFLLKFLQHSCFSSLFLMELAIAIERAIFVFRPLHYYTLVTKGRVVISLFVICAYVIATGLVPAIYPLASLNELQEMVSPDIAYFLSTPNFTTSYKDFFEFLQCEAQDLIVPGYTGFLYYGNFVPAMCVTACLFASILWTARKLAKITTVQQAVSSSQQLPSLTGQQTRTVALLLVSNIVLALLWLPTIIFIPLDAKLFSSQPTMDLTQTKFYMVMAFLSKTSTLVVPCLFATMQKDFRKAIRNLWCVCRRGLVGPPY